MRRLSIANLVTPRLAIDNLPVNTPNPNVGQYSSSTERAAASVRSSPPSSLTLQR